MTPLVYVAGGSSERLTIVRPFIDRLFARGILVTYDWTRDPGWDDPMHDRSVSAVRDLMGIQRCGMLWYIAPQDKSEGSHCELGIAIGLGKPIITSGPAREMGRVFPLLAPHYADHETAFDIIAGAT